MIGLTQPVVLVVVVVVVVEVVVVVVVMVYPVSHHHTGNGNKGTPYKHAKARRLGRLGGARGVSYLEHRQPQLGLVFNIWCFEGSVAPGEDLRS